MQTYCRCAGVVSLCLNPFLFSSYLLTHCCLVMHMLVSEQWLLVQVMACCLLGARQLPEPIIAYSYIANWTLGNQLHKNLDQIKYENYLKKMHLKSSHAKSCPCLYSAQWVDSMWPCDAIWRQRSWSKLAQVMAWCLMAPSHYLNQYWLTISNVQCQIFEGNFTKDTSAIYQ